MRSTSETRRPSDADSSRTWCGGRRRDHIDWRREYAHPSQGFLVGPPLAFLGAGWRGRETSEPLPLLIPVSLPTFSSTPSTTNNGICRFLQAQICLHQASPSRIRSRYEGQGEGGAPPSSKLHRRRRHQSVLCGGHDAGPIHAVYAGYCGRCVQGQGACRCGYHFHV
ncbi:hypothetical protein BD309DRAFT_443524 [Dichomitus squalens]|nr:hypothetical protein BD309DRAFT_443524 [Dichomitus squalens]